MKKKLEQVSRTRFLTGFEFRALSFGAKLRSSEEEARNSNSLRNRVLESCSNIFFHSKDNTLPHFQIKFRSG